jgi:hypothetical protein
MQELEFGPMVAIWTIEMNGKAQGTKVAPLPTPPEVAKPLTYLL